MGDECKRRKDGICEKGCIGLVRNSDMRQMRESGRSLGKRGTKYSKMISTYGENEGVKGG